MRKIILIFIGLTFINVLLQCTLSPAIQPILINSDSLYLPTLFSDVLSGGGDFKDWYLTPAPYFFPDYPAFLIAYLIGSTPYSQLIAFALIQSTITLVGIWFLAKTTLKSDAILVSGATFIVLMNLALIDSGPFIYLLTCTFHYGSTLAGMFLAALWLKAEGNESTSNQYIFYSLMSLIGFAIALSDQLYLVQVVAPLVATQVVVILSKRVYSPKQLFPLLLFIFASWFGVAVYKHIVANPNRFPVVVGLQQVSGKLSTMYEVFGGAIKSHPILGVGLLLYLVIVFHSSIRLIQVEKEHYRLNWFILFTFLSVCASVGAVLLNTTVFAYTWYQLPLLTWPPIAVSFFLASHLDRRLAFVPLAILSAMLVLMSKGSFRFAKETTFQKHMYPDDVACIDKLLEASNLKIGIAQYWDAKYIQGLSKLNLILTQFDSRLAEWRWITSKKYYKDEYDFAIIDNDLGPPWKLPADALVRLNGPPKNIATCGNKSVYVYDKGKVRTRRPIAVGETYVHNLCQPSTQPRDEYSNCQIQQKNGSLVGQISFDAADRLPSGKYSFIISYASSEAKDIVSADWDVVLALPENELSLSSGPIQGTMNASSVVAGNFVVPPANDWEMFKIMTKSRQHRDLRIKAIEVKRSE